MRGGSSPIVPDSTGISLRRLWRQLKEGPFPPGHYTQSRPVEDPGHQSALSLFSLHEAAKICEGVITDVTALCNCYRVQLEKMHYPITATLGVLGCHGAFGSRSIATLTPGTKVHVVWHPQLYYGVILSAIPFAQTAGNKNILGLISQASRARVDSAHLKPLQLGGGFVTDWMAGRPFDATNAGEQGWITETGMRVFLNSFVCMVGLDEACSLTTFYHDQLVKLAAYNLRIFTSGCEREGMDDQGEYNDWEGVTPYPWEQLGLFAPGDPRRELSDKQWQLDEPYYGNWEPKDDRQAPWHRDTSYRGYMGQGGKRILRAPPVSAGQFHTFAPGSGRTQFPVLADHSVGMDGRVVLASAKGVSIVKRIGIPGPTRLYLPEQIQDEGDSPSNYKAAGLSGSGPNHTISGNLRASGRKELTRATGLLDLHAYWFNYANNVGFYYHAKDWYVPEEQELTHTGGRVTAPVAFAQLAQQMFLEAPPPQKIKIDHRYNLVDYYQNTSGIEFLEDGGVVLYDGFGSSITMTAGHIYIDAPGDVWQKAGRTAVIWGGDDTIIRAKNSVDITCTEQDIRLKAEKNLHMLAGNDGQTGGILLESRAPSVYEFEGQQGEDVRSGGIILRAVEGDVVNWAKRIYLRTGGGDITNPGPIYLDAARGEQPIIGTAQKVQYYSQDGLYLHFTGNTEGVVDTSTYFTADNSGIASPMCLGGMLTLDGNLLMRGYAMIAEGHILTEQATSTTMVLPLEGEGLQAVYEALDQGQSQLTNLIPQLGVEDYNSTLLPLFYADDKPGSDTVIRNAEFSLRSLQQYGTQGFELYESRWQQLARLAGGSGNTWFEKPVACRLDPDTHPYPGKENFQQPVLQQLDLQLFDAGSGNSRSRGGQPNLQGIYADPTYAEPVPMSLNTYAVIR